MKYILISLLVFISCSVSGQALKGKVLDQNNNPIAYATVYIKEKTLGIMADELGQFQTTIEQGEYTLEFRSIGYENLIKKVVVPQDGLNLQIKLVEKPVQLNEITIKPSNEDPAYKIMRNVISRAPYHLYQVASYTSEVYMKGSGKLEKIPKLLLMSTKDKNLVSLVGKILVYESKNTVSYTLPDKYKQRVVAFKSSFPKELEPKNGVKIPTSSIYYPYFLGKISPLSTKAMQYYKFKYLDAFQNGQHQIYKISFTPKFKNDQLSPGILYVVNDEWSIYTAEFDLSELGIKSHAKINYEEIKPNVFLPITIEEKMNIDLMGIKANSFFFTSTKYTALKLNQNAVNAQSKQRVFLKKESLSKEKQKALDELEKYTAKEKLSTKDALKIAKLSSVINKNDDKIKEKKTLEIKPRKSLVEIEKDSLANEKDSTYWESIRTVPIKKEEEMSYKQVDSFPKFNNVSQTGEEIIIKAERNNKWNWLLGGKNKLGKTMSVYYDGLLSSFIKDYNFVDGFWLGQKVGINIETTKNTKFNFEPFVYYTTARKSIVWGARLSQEYLPLRNGLWQFSIGNTSEDIMHRKGISHIYNSLTALFNGTNGISFYQKKYITVENSLDIANGLRLSFGGSYEKRSLLQNNTDFNIVGKPIKPNFPENRFSELPEHTNSQLWSQISWIPQYYYKIKNGKKQYVFSKYPTFILQYTKALPIFSNSVSSEYDKINLSAKQTISTGLSEVFRYNLNVGAYLAKTRLFAPDYNYFSTIPTGLTDRAFTETFALLPNYTYFNNAWWESHLTYESQHLLLKQIPFLQKIAFNESFHLNTLWDYKGKTYNELGYSIGFSEKMRIALFSSFTGLKFNNIGIKISLSIK